MKLLVKKETRGAFVQYLPLDKKEVLRYLGYRRQQVLTPEVSALVDIMMLDVQTITKPRYYYQAFDFTLDEANQAIHVMQTDLVLQSKQLFKVLKEAKKIVLLATTLGIDVERQIRRYEATELTKALVLDATCVAFIETLCDLAEVDMAHEFSEFTLNRRFSPGYGDLALSVQPQFLNALDANRQLGISLTENDLMIPRKSVTAIIGLFEDATVALPRRQPPQNLTLDMAKLGHFNIGGLSHDND